MENEKRRHHKKKVDTLLRLFFVLFLVTFLISGYKVFSILREQKKAANAYTDLRTELAVTVQTTKPAPPTAAATTAAPQESTATSGEDAGETLPVETVEQTEPYVPTIPVISVDVEALQRIYPQIVGWINLWGTNIDYPVMQGTDNDYYLTHLYNGEVNSNGSIFVDCRCSGDFTDRNTVVYGHYMKSGAMFKDLRYYKDPAYYEKNPVVMLYLPDGDYRIEVISGTLENGDGAFLRLEFADDEDLINYVNSFRARSTFQSPVTLEPGDRIVTLCTCSFEWDDARYVVIGKLVPVLE